MITRVHQGSILRRSCSMYLLMTYFISLKVASFTIIMMSMPFLIQTLRLKKLLPPFSMTVYNDQLVFKQFYKRESWQVSDNHHEPKEQIRCQDIFFDLNGFKINCEDNVKLLYSSVDFKLKFGKRHSDICKKTSRKILIKLHLKALVHEQIKLSYHLLQLYF